MASEVSTKMKQVHTSQPLTPMKEDTSSYTCQM